MLITRKKGDLMVHILYTFYIAKRTCAPTQKAYSYIYKCDKKYVKRYSNALYDKQSTERHTAWQLTSETCEDLQCQKVTMRERLHVRKSQIICVPAGKLAVERRGSRTIIL